MEEDKEHQDLSFLSGETGFEKNVLGRFVLAYKLVQQGIQTEFWFALLGGLFYQFNKNQDLKQQLGALLDALPSLDAAAVRKSRNFAASIKTKYLSPCGASCCLARGIPEAHCQPSLSGSAGPTFVKSALEHAGITDGKQQEAFARLFNEHKILTPELLDALEKDSLFKKEEIADLHTSFQLSDLTRGDFTVVKMLKDEFGVRRPEQIRTLAKRGEDQWVKLVQAKHAAGDIKLPLEVSAVAGQAKLPEAVVYGKTLERQFREAFPTTAFAGGLERALKNGGAHGLRQAEALDRFLAHHENFELLNTPVDDFLNNNIRSEFQLLAKDEGFRLELKAVQRVFKLAPDLRGDRALLADGLHSAQQIYRLGESCIRDALRGSRRLYPRNRPSRLESGRRHRMLRC